MVEEVFRSVVFENPSGRKAIISDPSVTKLWEIGGRQGFTAPDVELISQKYVGGQSKLLKSIKQPRTVRLNMILIGESRAERDTAFRKLVDILMDTSKGDEGKLWITRSDGLKLYLTCAYSSGLNVIDEYKRYHRFTLEFYATDYKFHGVDIEKKLGGDYFTGITLSQTLELGSWALGQGTMSGTGLIQNPLQSVVNPIYKMSGARSTLSITNNSNKQNISFSDLDMVASDMLVIDTREEVKDVYIVHIDGSTTNAVSCLDWNNVELVLQLEPGSNSLTLESLGGIGTLSIVIGSDYISA